MAAVGDDEFRSTCEKYPVQNSLDYSRHVVSTARFANIEVKLVANDDLHHRSILSAVFK